MATMLLDRPAPLADDATRREFLIGGLSLATLLTACADVEQAPEPTSPGDGRFPTTIEHKYGSTEIPAEPKRVVCVGLLEQDALLALGVVPVATTELFGEQPGAIFPWARDELGSAALPEVLSVTDGIQFERVAALRPDLILGLYAGLTDQDYTRLSQIASTVAQPAEFVDYGIPWQHLTRAVGRAVGQREQAERLIAGIEARYARIRAEHPKFTGATVAYTSFADAGNFYGLASQDPRSRLLTDMGFEVPAEIDELAGDQFYAEISRERLDLFDTNVLVMYVENEDQREAIRRDPLYATLKVATQGRDIFVLDGTEVSDTFNFVSVLSLPHLLDRLVPMLAAAIDGDPATEVPS